VVAKSIPQGEQKKLALPFLVRLYTRVSPWTLLGGILRRRMSLVWGCTPQGLASSKIAIKADSSYLVLGLTYSFIISGETGIEALKLK
jgi:hypothetical protein